MKKIGRKNCLCVRMRSLNRLSIHAALLFCFLRKWEREFHFNRYPSVMKFVLFVLLPRSTEHTVIILRRCVSHLTPKQTFIWIFTYILLKFNHRKQSASASCAYTSFVLTSWDLDIALNVCEAWNCVIWHCRLYAYSSEWQYIFPETFHLIFRLFVPFRSISFAHSSICFTYPAFYDYSTF